MTDVKRGYALAHRSTATRRDGRDQTYADGGLSTSFNTFRPVGMIDVYRLCFAEGIHDLPLLRGYLRQRLRGRRRLQVYPWLTVLARSKTVLMVPVVSAQN